MNLQTPQDFATQFAVAPNRLTATQALEALKTGRLTATDLVKACLQRIEIRDGDVRAWLHLNPYALRLAAELDALPREQRGKLHGLPIGIKDVFETKDMPTTFNSPNFEGHQPGQDAAAVDLLRAEGAIILGKTDTTEFAAAGRNAATGNPHDTRFSSGGSSAGSAASVADFQVPLSIGTQTGGSTIRPASFCGVYAFKPTFGVVSREGFKIYANTLDTVGWYGRSVADLSLLADVFGLMESIKPALGTATLRIGITLGPYRDRLQPESVQAMQVAADRFRKDGHDVTHLELPTEFSALDHYHRTILHREGAAAFRNLARRFGSELHDDFHHRVENRDGRSLSELRDAYDAAAKARVQFDRLAAEFDVILVPSAPGHAPEGRHPGDPVFNAMWTLLGVPCVNVPVFMQEAPLPIGVTLTGPRFSDPSLLAAAARLAPLIDCARSPYA
ncbi:Asp-tRNA(Asn)/Glu-tRNA(Gln) amidotransferase A subunit family amidase [Rhizobium aquaticum]|uniref:Asp-tRNA(Asn)/Glu-tRNA(Gln) amidotransferase A subunit family amidase n=1 Tax=Rhizobium aquaticum TaxID=1549636 RepID=A0ABV2J2M5_9HYPH